MTARAHPLRGCITARLLPRRKDALIPAPTGADWRLWQLLDSAFPAGGLAHSAGLEAAWQWGWLGSAADVEAFLRESLAQITCFSLPFVRAALGADDVTLLDAHLDTFMTNHIARRASRLQGMAFLATAADVFELPHLAALRQRMLRQALPGHYAVIFGAVMRSLAVDPPRTLRIYLFIAMRGMLSAAVRLGIIGPLEAQRLQIRLDGPLEAAAETALGLTLADVCQTSPPLELWQMGQDRLYSRLFQS